MRRRIFTVWLRVVNGLGGCGARLILDLKKGNANAGFGRLDLRRRCFVFVAGSRSYRAGRDAGGTGDAGFSQQDFYDAFAGFAVPVTRDAAFFCFAF